MELKFLKNKLETALEEFKSEVSALTISDCIFSEEKSIECFSLTERDRMSNANCIAVCKKKKNIEGNISYLVEYTSNHWFDEKYCDFYSYSTEGFYCEGFRMRNKWISSNEYSELLKFFEGANSVEVEVTRIKLTFTNGKDIALNNALGKVERIIGNFFNGILNNVIPTPFYRTTLPHFSEDRVEFTLKTYNIANIIDNTAELTDETKEKLFEGIKKFLLSATVTGGLNE
ncbi:MAG: hypothetical protein J6A37_16735 [Oscillospiraceae bacterium]|nr:hypothetical protein [Oscillospiraceae bacterium]